MARLKKEKRTGESLVNKFLGGLQQQQQQQQQQRKRKRRSSSIQSETPSAPSPTPSPGAKRHKKEDVDRFRRPTGIYTGSLGGLNITAERWETLLDSYQNGTGRTAKTARNELTKRSKAGDLFETDVGADAGQPCRWCARQGHQYPCRVRADGTAGPCGFCLLQAKSNCSARLAGPVKDQQQQGEVDSEGSSLSNLSEQEFDESTLDFGMFGRVNSLGDLAGNESGQDAEAAQQLAARVEKLEQEVAELQQQLAAMRDENLSLRASRDGEIRALKARIGVVEAPRQQTGLVGPQTGLGGWLDGERSHWQEVVDRERWSAFVPANRK